MSQLEPCKLLIPEIPEDIFNSMTAQEQATYLRLYREQVAPKFEEWRNPHRVKCAYGGRGAGAKSRSSAKLLLQFAENPSYFGESLRVLCVRDVQKSIAESSWRLLRDELERLQYSGWEVTNTAIRNTKNGSYFVFAGLNDLSVSTLKSYESFNILFVEEGDPIGKTAWNTIIPTFRKEGSEIWCLFNRNLARDPCYELFCENPEPDWSIIVCRPGNLDNPWFDQTTLPAEWARMRKTDPDEARHVYEGLPRQQGDKAIFSQASVQAIAERVASDEGAIEIGCDVARFGKDKTIAYKRKGLRTIARESVQGYDTVQVAGMLWDMANKDPALPIKIDSGYNPGVIDLLKEWGANVVPIGFGECALEADSYTNAAAEMYFNLPIDELSMPAEWLTRELFEDLTERYFGYDSKGRKKLEPKDGTSTDENGNSKKNFKDRHGGRSPDEGDALALTFYERVAHWELL